MERNQMTDRTSTERNNTKMPDKRRGGNDNADRDLKTGHIDKDQDNHFPGQSGQGARTKGYSQDEKASMGRGQEGSQGHGDYDEDASDRSKTEDDDDFNKLTDRL